MSTISESISGPVAEHDKIKYTMPDGFYENRIKLQTFLIQNDIYIMKHSRELGSASQRVLFMRSYLRKLVADGFDPHVQDWLSKADPDRKPKTQELFGSYIEFKEELKRNFKGINIEQIMKRKIQDLHQTENITEYIARFQQIVIHYLFIYLFILHTSLFRLWQKRNL